MTHQIPKPVGFVDACTMAKDKAPKPSRPYRGGHTGKGGAHEKGGCLAAILVFIGSTAGLAEVISYWH
jgi:hypothetical protein